MKPSRIGQVLAYAAASVLAVFFLLPFYVIWRNAFSSQQAIVSPQWNWWPDQLDLTTLTTVLGTRGSASCRPWGTRRWCRSCRPP